MYINRAKRVENACCRTHHPGLVSLAKSGTRCTMACSRRKATYSIEREEEGEEKKKLGRQSYTAPRMM